MNDFDFEELDKAVGALASKTHEEHGGAAPSEPVTVTPASPVKSASAEQRPARHLTISQPVPTAPTPSTSSPEAQPQPVSVPAAKHRLTDARPKNRGAFMDIVPPASRKTPSRAGVSVQPISNPEDILPEEPGPASDSLPPKDQADTAKAVPQPLPETDMADRAQPKPQEPPAKPAATPSVAKSDEVAWPDPLDFHDSSAQKESTKQPAAASPQDAADTPELAEPTSPFLTEAKVNKRPLGAFSNFKPTEEPEPPAPPDLLNMAEDSTPSKEESQPPKAPLPPQKSDKEAEEEPASPDLHGKAMMSIPDQYRTEPKATDKTPRPVYDTKEYHPPLIEATAHEHHRGSMWGKIFVAFLVLALLIAVGYMAYIFMMPRQ